MLTPVPVCRLERIHSGRREAEKWALGIFDRGEKKRGWRMYLYSKRDSRRGIAMIVSEAMFTLGLQEEVERVVEENSLNSLNSLHFFLDKVKYFNCF